MSYLVADEICRRYKAGSVHRPWALICWGTQREASKLVLIQQVCQVLLGEAQVKHGRYFFICPLTNESVWYQIYILQSALTHKFSALPIHRVWRLFSPRPSNNKPAICWFKVSFCWSFALCLTIKFLFGTSTFSAVCCILHNAAFKNCRMWKWCQIGYNCQSC